ncbi:hypothetical protein CJI97_003264 [Candidozyma auris]|nr:hypothetical protein CJI97_003264 [[Candida] auris]
MSLEDDNVAPSARMSMDTTVNINDDVASEPSHVSDKKQVTESVYSNFRGSMGDDSIISAFNILKLGLGEEEKEPDAFSPLGPNSIFELTSASDIARVKQNKPLKTYITVNGGANTVYNLTQPTSRDIPQIQLQSLKNKVSSKRLSQDLVKGLASEYKSFEQTNRTLTEDVLSKLADGTADQDRGHVNESNDEIPAIFENPDFHLDDPRTFRQVMENSQILPDPDSNDNSHIVNNTEVQEKLSHYLDRVEVELISEISKTSDSFFSTLGEVQSIKADGLECMEQFRAIKDKLSSIEIGQAKRGLEILDMLDERQNLCHLESSVLQIQQVIILFKRAEKYFAEGNHSKCLDSILIIEHLIEGTSREDYPDPVTYKDYPRFEYPMVSLRGIPALTPIKNKLTTLKELCSRGYIESFLDLLLEDLRSHYKSVSSRDTMNRIYVSVYRGKYDTEPNTSYAKVSTETKEQLTTFIQSLHKSSHLIEAFAEYQNKIIAEVKAIIRARLPSSSRLDPAQLEASSNPDSRDSSIPPDSSQMGESTSMATNSLFNNIKELSHDEFLGMMKETFSNLSECLRRLTIHQKLLLDLSLSSLTENDTFDVMSLDITNSINRAIELTQVRLAKVSNVRSEQLCETSIEDYLKFYTYGSAYLSECEFINPGYNATEPGSSLYKWIKNHVGLYLHRFHNNSIKRFAHNCDKEIWKECTDANEIGTHQILLDEVLEYCKYHETEGKSGSNGKKWSDLLVFYEQDTHDKEVEEKRAFEKVKFEINKRNYLVPPLMLDVVGSIRGYLVLSSIFSSRAPTLRSYILTYFRVVNSRTSQAILGAGATNKEKAGLKHITTKHIALCIQTIEFAQDILRSIQHVFREQEVEVNQGQQNAEELTFEKMLINYQEHERELSHKIVQLIKDRTSSHCHAIKQINWSEPLKAGQQCHPYMEALSKDTITVFKILSKYLRETEYSSILSQIFENYKKLLLNCFCTELPQFKDFNEKHSLLKDIDFFRVKLGEIPGYGNSGQVIWENVNALPTIEDARMEEVMKNNIEGERAAAARSSADINGVEEKKENNEKESLASTQSKTDDNAERRAKTSIEDPSNEGQGSKVAEDASNSGDKAEPKQGEENNTDYAEREETKKVASTPSIPEGHQVNEQATIIAEPEEVVAEKLDEDPTVGDSEEKSEQAEDAATGEPSTPTKFNGPPAQDES